MSIDIRVGVLADDDPILPIDAASHRRFLDYMQAQFAAVNQFLHHAGLPEHHEPTRLPAAGYAMTASSDMYPFRDYAWHAALQTGRSFDHLLELSGEEAIYLPRDLPEPLGPVPGLDLGSMIGSAYRLFDECRTLAKLLGMYDDIHYPDDLPPQIQQLDHANGIHDDPATPAPLRPRRPGEPWPRGASACQPLFEAAKRSIRTNAALIIH